MYIKIDENNRIIAYSDIRQKGFIEVKEKVKLNNLFNYLYVNNEFIYSPLSPNLKIIKSEKREELKKIRKEKIDSDLEVNGNYFQVRERDLQNFYNLKIAVDLEPDRATMRTTWVLADNSIKEFSFEELMGVLGAYILRKSEIFAKFGELCTRLESCQTVEEIKSIKWE